MAPVNGLRMTINALNRAVSVPEVVIAAVLQRPTVQEVHMAPPLQLVQMAMELRLIWVRCLLPRAVSSIPPQVSSVIIIEEGFTLFMLIIYGFVFLYQKNFPLFQLNYFLFSFC